MKKYRAIFILGMSSLAGSQESGLASKGAVVEGLFILQNKYLAVKQAIQELKKEVSVSSQEKSRSQAPQPSFEAYHAKLKQLLYPTYIDELGLLAASLEKDIALLNGIQPVSKQIFEGIMNRAFLAGAKIDIEKKLLSKIFEVDKQEYELTILQQAHDTYRKAEGRRIVSDLASAVAKAKEEVAALKIALVGINKELYTGELKQHIFLNKLAFRRK